MKKETKDHKYYYFLRILRLVNILRVANNGFSVVEVSQAFNVSVPTVKRDMADLRKIGVPIFSYKNSGIELRDKHYNATDALEYFYNKLQLMERTAWKQSTN